MSSKRELWFVLERAHNTWSKLSYLFKVESTEFAGCLDVRSELKRGVDDDP